MAGGRLVKAASKPHFSGMRHLLLIFLHLVGSLVKLLKPDGAKALVAENCLLKHQLLIARRSRRRAPNLRFSDRVLFGLGSLFLRPRRLLRTAILIKPSTLLRCHRALAELKLKWLYSSGHRHKPGPKGPGQDLIQAIAELKRRNPHLGCRKIAQQLAKSFAIELDRDVVRRVLATHYRSEGRDDGPSWLALLGHTKDSLWSVDLFRAESLLLKSHWVLVVMDVFTRRIIGFGVQPVVVDGPALCRMFNRIIAGQAMPKRLSYDHDPLFEFQRWQANLRILGIESVRSVPYSPVSHPFIERLIGTVRREYMDRLFFWNECDLERKLEQFKSYYNQRRVHQSLNGATPEEQGARPISLPVDLQHYGWQRHCNGLFELPIAA
jgi:putative transposase